VISRSTSSKLDGSPLAISSAWRRAARQAGSASHVELHVGVREDGGADVAAVQHDTTVAAYLTLEGDHAAPHAAVG